MRRMLKAQSLSCTESSPIREEYAAEGLGEPCFIKLSHWPCGYPSDQAERVSEGERERERERENEKEFNFEIIVKISY